MGSPRRLSFDHLKALLLVLVIFGHTFEAGVHDDLVKYVIYSFHMPLFLFVSGYLLNTQRLATSTLPAIGRRYWSRMLWQWLVVSIAFELFMGGFRGASTRESIWLLVVEPRYHLWFIPTLGVAILMIWIAAPYRRAHWWMGAGSLITFLLFATPLRQALDLSVPFDSRYLSYVFFAWAGVTARAYSSTVPFASLAGGVLFAVGMALHVAGFADGGWPRSLGFLILNMGVFLAFPALLRLLDHRVPLLSTWAVLLSTYSLWVYLLHPFATQLLTVPSGSVLTSVTLGLAVTALVAAGALAIAWVWDAVGVRSRTQVRTGQDSQTIA